MLNQIYCFALCCFLKLFHNSLYLHTSVAKPLNLPGPIPHSILHLRLLPRPRVQLHCLPIRRQLMHLLRIQFGQIPPLLPSPNLISPAFPRISRAICCAHQSRCLILNAVPLCVEVYSVSSGVVYGVIVNWWCWWPSYVSLCHALYFVV
jgi:hypothetical protein